MVSIHLSIQGEEMSEKRKVVAVSGGFDPVHVGHVQMIEEAAEHGDVMVIINSDEWLLRKKGYVFMPWREREYIMSQFKGVTKVVSVDDSDDSVCEALRTHRPDCFANGGDRRKTNTPEMDLCEELDIALMWNVGGGKIQSSSDLVNKAKWGKMVINGVEI